jgi:hypothetical protein
VRPEGAGEASIRQWPASGRTHSITGGSGATPTLKAGARTEKFDVDSLTFG